MIQTQQIPSHVLSLYFSKQNIGIAHFDKQNLQLQCSLLQHYIPNTQFLIKKLISQKSIQLILTNNDKHILLLQLSQQIKITRIQQKGLDDDVIENNISILKFNPIKQHINNKSQYIKLMKQHSQSRSIFKQKYKTLGIILFFLFNSSDFSITSSLYINDILYFKDHIFKFLQISSSQLQTLQIIKQQVHPSFIKGKGRSKQGFSILSLYQTPLSSSGSKKILRYIFKNPTYDQHIIQTRLDIITWLKKLNHDNKALLKLFHSIHTIDIILNKFNQSRAQDEDWKKFVKSLQSMVIIHKIMQEKTKSNQCDQIPQFFHHFFNDINWGDIAKILSTIISTLDLELSYGTIKRGVDPELDQLKKTYDNLPHLLTLYARQQNWSEDFRIVFMSQIGYLIRVPHDIEIPIQFSPQKWNLQFIKNSGKFYCNDLTMMLDEQYGDIYGYITDRQKKIIFQLENIVSQYFQIIQQAYWKICQLQCFIGISIVSNGMCRPKLSSQALIVSRSWHLLLAQDAIENHAFSFNHMQAPHDRIFNSEQNLVNTNYSNRVMLISGPNGSGKTIYMKQIAIIVYLTHLGFYVPAQFAQIPITDKIILLQSKRSIYRGNNGFESEIASLTKLMTPGMFSNKSLILIDELAASIDNILAKKFLFALLKFLCDTKGSNIPINEQLSKESDKFQLPLTIAITHLTDTVTNSLLKENYFVRYITMDMERDQICLFKIKPGLVKKGYGIQRAKAFMDQSFITKAQNYWHSIRFDH